MRAKETAVRAGQISPYKVLLVIVYMRKKHSYDSVPGEYLKRWQCWRHQDQLMLSTRGTLQCKYGISFQFRKQDCKEFSLCRQI